MRMFRGWYQQSKWGPCLSILPKSSGLLCVFWVKVLSAKDIHEEMFSIYGGKCSLREAVDSWVATFR
jgi:hypothetical protein